MANIGNLAVSLSLDAAEFAAGLDKSSAGMKAFGGAAGGAMSDVAAMGKRAEQVMRSVETPTEAYHRKLDELDHMLQAGAISQETFNRAAAKAESDLKAASGGMGELKIAAVAAATAVAAVWAAWKLGEMGFEWIKGGIDKVADVGRNAEKLGISTEKLSALQFAAGRDAGVWETALRHLNTEIGAAAMGSAEAAAKFRSFGLDGKDLAAMGEDAAINKIADKFKGVTDSAIRAKMAEELFSREGSGLIPVLAQGAAGLEAAAAAAKKYGQLVSSADASKAMAAQRALDDLGKSWEGLQRQAAISFAPVLADAVTTITDLLNQGDHGKSFFDQLATGAMGFLADVLGGIVSAYEGVKGVAKEIGEIVSDVKWLKDVGAHIGNGVTKGVWEGNKELKESGGAAGENSHDKFLNDIKAVQDKVIKMQAEAQARLDKLGKPKSATELAAAAAQAAMDKHNTALLDAGKLTGTLDDQAAAYGMTGSAVERFKLARQGLTDAELAGVDVRIREMTTLQQITEGLGAGLNIFQQQASQVQKLNDALRGGVISLEGYNAAYQKLAQGMEKKIDAAAFKVAEETASPLDKFKAGVGELDQLMAAGKINATQYAAEVAKEWEGVGKTLEEVHHPAAVEQGSVAAYETVLHDQDRNRPGDVQERIAAAIDRLEKQQAAAERTNQQIADAINRIFVKGK